MEMAGVNLPFPRPQDQWVFLPWSTGAEVPALPLSAGAGALEAAAEKEARVNTAAISTDNAFIETPILVNKHESQRDCANRIFRNIPEKM